MPSGEQEHEPVPRHLPTGQKHSQLRTMALFPTKHKALGVNTYRITENSDKRN